MSDCDGVAAAGELSESLGRSGFEPAFGCGLESAFELGSDSTFGSVSESGLMSGSDSTFASGSVVISESTIGCCLDSGESMS